MQRYEYIEAAIMSDKDMYLSAECDAYAWNEFDTFHRYQSIADFIILYKNRINEMFSWAHFMSEEIARVYINIVENFEEC